MTYRPGQSGNPSGRPRGAAGLARYIAEQTADGRELVDRLLALSRDSRGAVREKCAATLALLDRLVGKPMQPSEIAMTMETTLIPYPATWDAMPPADRVAWLGAHRARLLSGGES